MAEGLRCPPIYPSIKIGRVRRENIINSVCHMITRSATRTCSVTLLNGFIGSDGLYLAHKMGFERNNSVMWFDGVAFPGRPS